jgi:hypothetical protein
VRVIDEFDKAALGVFVFGGFFHGSLRLLL